MLAGSHSDNSFCNRDDWFTFGSPRATSSIEVWKINFVLLLDIFHLTRFSNKRFKIVAISFIFCFYFVFSFFSNCHSIQNVEKIEQNIARQESRWMISYEIIRVAYIYLLHNSTRFVHGIRWYQLLFCTALDFTLCRETFF